MDAEWDRLKFAAEEAVRRGDWTIAEGRWLKAAKAAEREFGGDDPRLCWTLENLAETFWHQGKFHDAVFPTKRVLEIYEITLGEDHLDVATLVNNLGMLQHAMQHYNNAELLYKRALAIKQRRLGERHPDSLAIMQNLAHVLDMQKKTQEAAAMRAKAEGAEKGQFSRSGRWEAYNVGQNETLDRQ